MPRPKKAAQPKLSKEQIAMRMAQEQEAIRFKNLIRDELFPVLQSVGSLNEAKSLCEVMGVVINGAMNNYWEDKTIKNLNLIGELNSDAEAKDKETFEAVIHAVEDLSIGDAQKLLKGMGGVLDGYARKIADAKPMSEIKVEEIIAV